MDKKVVRQTYFVSKEIRISIALIVVWSFLSVAFFIYMVRQFGNILAGHGILAFISILLGYAIVVVLLSVVFSHRLIGPFERLNSEIALILSGDFPRRLRIREKDDISIRTFVENVNKLLDELEETSRWSNYCFAQIQSVLSGLQSSAKNKEIPENELRGMLTSAKQRVDKIISEHMH